MLKHIRSAALAAAIALFALLAASCSEPENQVRITFADGTAIPADGIELSALGSVSLKAQIRADVNADEVTWDIVGSGSGENSKAGTVAAEGVNGAVLKAGSILGASARVMAKYGDAFAEVRFKVSAGSMTLPSVGAVPPIQTGSSGTFRIELPYDAAEDPNAEWSSSAPAVASVDDEGEVTVHNDDNANSGKVATITTRYSNKDSGRTERSVDVVIEGELLPEGVTVSPSGAKEFVLGNEADASLSLTATADESATFPEIEWVSSAPSVAEVSAAGVVTPKAVGSASVAARYVMHNEIASDPVAITVRDPKVDVIAWDGASSAWAASGTVSAAWGSKLSAALANAASPLEVSLGEGDAAVPYVFDRWSAAAPAADADPSTYAGAALADGDVLDADGKEAYAVYKVKSYSVSFKVWDPAASAWADLKDGQDAAYVQTYDHGDLFDNTGIPAAAAPAGYGFAGWASFATAPASVDAALLASGTEYVSGTTAVKADVTLYACYSSSGKVTVRWMSWDAGNGEWTEFGSQQFESGDAYADPESVPSSTTSGASTLYFTGWKAADQAPASPFDANALAFSDDEERYSNDSLSSGATLYAVYEPAYPPRMKRMTGVAYSDSKGFMMTGAAQVGISGFEIGEYEVTQALWKEVWDWVDAEEGRKAQYPKVYNNGVPNPSDFDGTEGKEAAAGEDQALRPAEKISWFAACEFCNALSAMSGLTPFYAITVNGDETTVTVADDWFADGYRLPTECEWQYAAAGGEYATGNEPSTGSKYTYAGGDDRDAVAWYTDNSSSKTHQVRRKKANGYGLFDMSGNVLEWCWDWWADPFDGNGRQDYTGPDSGSYRVCRGGSWCDNADDCSVSNRCYDDASSTYSTLGFRLARSARGGQ